MSGPLDSTHRAARLLPLSCLAFVALGLPDGLLGVAWPSMREDFDLSQRALGALLSSVTIGYVTSAFASGWLLARLDLGRLLAASCLVTALCLWGYGRAPTWTAMLGLGLFAGLAAGAIDAGINTHAASRSAPRTLSLLHAAYGLGTTSGPFLMAGLLAEGIAWPRGYAVVATAQAALALCFLGSRRTWTERPPGTAGDRATTPARVAATLRLPATRLSLLVFFLYTGLEASLGAWTYTLLAEEGRALPIAAAGAGLFWAGLLSSRVAMAFAPAGLPPDAALRVCLVSSAVAALGLSLAASPGASLVAVAALGAACGPIFPLLIATTPRRVGLEHSSNAVGCQVAAAAAGQAVLPGVCGWIIAAIGAGVLPLLAATLAGTAVAIHAALARATLSDARVVRAGVSPRSAS